MHFWPFSLQQLTTKIDIVYLYQLHVFLLKRLKGSFLPYNSIKYCFFFGCLLFGIYLLTCHNIITIFILLINKSNIYLLDQDNNRLTAIQLQIKKKKLRQNYEKASVLSTTCLFDCDDMHRYGRTIN